MIITINKLMYSLQMELKNNNKLVACRYYAKSLNEIKELLLSEFKKVEKEFNNK